MKQIKSVTTDTFVVSMYETLAGNYMVVTVGLHSKINFGPLITDYTTASTIFDMKLKENTVGALH